MKSKESIKGSVIYCKRKRMWLMSSVQVSPTVRGSQSECINMHLEKRPSLRTSWERR
jgi:hypothetical protein